ncbi:MAG: flagellar filament capping protein FliD [Candidatus Eremiobacteraeota bacterium]|nr:flagellar filament capping protein FliD [Candidatus Eremiobacteraeota bacterium]
MSSSQIPGTNQPPISFPGIASGIDYNSIIQKLTSLTLAPEVQLNAQVATLNAANAELININNLFASVQSALGALSDPSLFDSWNATSSNPGVLTANGIPSVVATPGTYVINSVSVATATSMESNPLIGASERSNIAGGAYAGQPADSVPVADSYAAITPSNGPNGSGTITIDGVSVAYNVNTQSVNAIFASINAAVQTVDPSFSIGFIGATDTVEIQGSKPVTIGNATDSGNLEQVLKLDQAPNGGAGPPYTVVATSGVGGINATASLSNTATNAGFTAPVTGGVFTINGVAISVDPNGDNVSSILAKINASAAGVNASYNSATNQITLTSTSTGPQSIVVGAQSDTSNFLSLAGLTTGSGATSIIGKQAAVQLQQPNGSTSTVYSSSNTITNAIPGISLNLVSNDPSTPFSVVVASNTSNLVNALNTFVSSYNAAITEMNTATRAPIVTPSQPGALPSSASSTVGGGILYGNADVSTIKDELSNLVSGFFGSGTQYNSLSSIGLSLSSSFSVITTSNNGQSNGGSTTPGQGGAAQQTTYQGTDGTLQPLNSTTLLSALQQDPTAVAQIFQGANSLTTQVGTYLTGVTGFPTLLSTGTVGQVPTTSLMQNYENSITAEISSAQEQITQITDDANLQADGLRAQFVGTETTIAGLQSEQSQLAGFFKSSGG